MLGRNSDLALPNPKEPAVFDDRVFLLVGAYPDIIDFTQLVSAGVVDLSPPHLRNGKHLSRRRLPRCLLTLLDCLPLLRSLLLLRLLRLRRLLLLGGALLLLTGFSLLLAGAAGFLESNLRLPFRLLILYLRFACPLKSNVGLALALHLYLRFLLRAGCDLRLIALHLNLRLLLWLLHLNLRLRLLYLHLRLRLCDLNLRIRHTHHDFGLRLLDRDRRGRLPDNYFGHWLSYVNAWRLLLHRDPWRALLNGDCWRSLLCDNA